MHRLAVGTLVSTLLAVSLVVVGGTGMVLAAPICPGSNTQVCDGKVTPATGTTTTQFVFSLVYQSANAPGSPYSRDGVDRLRTAARP